MSKQFDAKALATDAVANAPEVTEVPTAETTKPTPTEPPQVSPADDNDGRAVAHSLNAAHHEYIGEDLNGPFVDAFGQVMSGVFSLMRSQGMGNGWRLGVLAVGIAPAVAVVGLRFWTKFRQGPEAAK